MRTETLAYINKTLNDLGINYSFARWNGDIPESYWIGEYSETDSLHEDGMIESDFILTGTTEGSWMNLQFEKELIERTLRNKTLVLESGVGLCINFERSLIVPTETESLKRIQMNFSIREWRNY
jgi:hypothetical protein